MKIIPVIVASILALCPLRAEPSAAPGEPEEEAIKQPALDYIEGWYNADAVRMERALHPELAKRIPRVDKATGSTRIESMGLSKLLHLTKAGGGSRVPEANRQQEITILDRYSNIAVLRVVSAEYVDYLQEAKVDGRWLIVNVLWTYRVGKSTR